MFKKICIRKSLGGFLVFRYKQSFNIVHPGNDDGLFAWCGFELYPFLELCCKTCSILYAYTSPYYVRISNGGGLKGIFMNTSFYGSLSGGRILGLFFDLKEVFTSESQRCYPGKFCEISSVNDSDKSAPAGLQSSLLCVEHVDKKGKPLLYLVFEYLDTDLKKYIDRHGRGPNNPIPPNTIQVSHKSFLPSFHKLEEIRRIFSMGTNVGNDITSDRMSILIHVRDSDDARVIL